MKSLSKRWEYLLALILASYCAYDLISTIHILWGFTTDDAYISWIYARHLVQGHGLVWHTHMPVVEGYSNFLWLIIAALIIKLQLPLITSIKIISCLSLAACLFFLYRLGRLFLSPLLAVLPVFIFSHFYGVAWWTVSGLETAFYCALSVLFIWQCARAFGYSIEGYTGTYSTQAWIFSNTTLLLLALTRFEGLVWILPASLFILCQLRSKRLHVPVALWSIISLVSFIIPYAVYFIWRWYYFGHLIPHSYMCKGLTTGNKFLVDFDYLVLLIPLILASIPYFLSHKDCRHWLLWTPSLLYGLMLSQADPVIAYALRLFLPAFAVFTVLPVLGVLRLFEKYPSRLEPKLATALVIIGLSLGFIPGKDVQVLQQSVANYQDRTKNRENIIAVINAQAAKGATVLLDDCGLIPFNGRSDLKFIDALCLNNPSPYSNQVFVYADYVELVLKPDWIISDYYPLLTPGTFLIPELQKRKFFTDYELVKELPVAGANRDFVYRIFRRKGDNQP